MTARAKSVVPNVAPHWLTHVLAETFPSAVCGMVSRVSTNSHGDISLTENGYFDLEIVEALFASPPTNKSILTDDEDNSVVVPLAKKISKHYNAPAIHDMAFILAIPG
ncbi:hypothetical protein TNCV_4230921 [Trichonephila clavipes]|uniref:Uncharacterized protein n=1 Tax=Trichonephila clavipes TaxID=2585209 RepID=A0A8X6SHN0_TRICX|nr:hypothetical protein TNCV_4230921 [Trichonephila clavipes]